MKTKSKSLISIVLSIMMVLSMVIVAVPVNATTVEDNSVGATTYYLWYNKDSSNDVSKYTNKVTMTNDGSDYVATFDVEVSKNFYFIINTSSSSNTGSLAWTTPPMATFDTDNFNWINCGDNYFSDYNGIKHYFVGSSPKTSLTVKVVYNPTNQTIDLTKATATPTTYSVSASELPTGASMIFSNTQGGASATSFEPNSIVYVAVTPPEGQECTGITVSSGAAVSGTGNSYSFTMPSSDVTVSATFSSSSSDMITYNKNETSGKTLLISYDENSPYRNWAHIWHKDEGSFIDGNGDNGEMTSVSSINGLYYIDITNSISDANANKLIYFIVKNGKGWNGSDNSGDIEPDSFKKGKQWYIVDTDNYNAEYTPLELDSLKYGAITGGKENTIKVVPAGGVPWLMNEKSGPATNYTLTVYSGEGTSGTKIVDSQTVAYNGEFSFEWTPNTTDTQQKLTFVLTDGIDTVSYPNTFDVTMPASTYSVTADADLLDGASLSFAKADDGTITDKYEADETVKVTVTTPEGYECTGITVSDGSEVTKVSDTVYSFQMPETDVTVSATFDILSFTINETVTNGTVDINPSGSVEYGTEVTINNFKPYDGYEFESITVDGAELTTVNEGSEYKFTMPANDVTVTVTFKEIHWYLSGTLQVTTGTGWQNIGAGVEDYKMNYEGNNIYTYSYTCPSTVKAFYAVVNDGTDDYHPATDNAPSDTPAEPKEFNNGPSEGPSWLVDGLKTDDKIRFTWNATAQTLSWEIIAKTYTITVSESITNGTVSCDTTSATAGDTVNFTVKPIDGYTIDTVTVTDATPEVVSTTDGTTTYSFEMPEKDVTISATFKQTVIEVPTLTGVTLNSSSTVVVAGQNFNLTATPTPGNASCTYEFYKATGETADPTNDTIINSNGNVAEITAEETPGTYKYYVVATDSSDNTVKFVSDLVTITVTEAAEEIETLTVWFKGTTLSSLKPYVSFDGADSVEMSRVTRDNGGYIGTHYSGSYQFYWYEATFKNITAGTEHTLLFTNSKGMNASITLDFTTCPADGKMYFAVDNLQAGTVAEDITYDPTKKICFRSSVNMISNVYESGDPLFGLQAANIALMNVDNSLVTKTCYFGDMNTDNSINVKDATAIQKLIAGIESDNPSYDVLADFDCNGVIDIKDATAIQKYSVGI